MDRKVLITADTFLCKRNAAYESLLATPPGTTSARNLRREPFQKADCVGHILNRHICDGFERYEIRATPRVLENTYLSSPGQTFSERAITRPELSRLWLAERISVARNCFRASWGSRVAVRGVIWRAWTGRGSASFVSRAAGEQGWFRKYRGFIRCLLYRTCIPSHLQF